MLEFNKVLSGSIEVKINGKIIKVSHLTIEEYLNYAEEQKLELLKNKRQEYIECCKLAGTNPNPKDLLNMTVQDFDTQDTVLAINSAFDLTYKVLVKSNPELTREELKGLGVDALSKITEIVMSELMPKKEDVEVLAPKN